MSEKIIPEYVDPYRFAELGRALSGTIMIADMSRLKLTMPQLPHSKVIVNLKFAKDEQDVVIVTGHLETAVILQCQRCLEPYTYEIIADFALGIADSLEQANLLPQHYESVLAKDGTLALRDVVEDEIILNLPIIPRHDPKSCKVKLPLADELWKEDKEENPFYILESLKNK